MYCVVFFLWGATNTRSMGGNLDVEVFTFVARIASLEHIPFQVHNDNTQGGVEPQNLEARLLYPLG
jgi:hypothetical protein